MALFVLNHKKAPIRQLLDRGRLINAGQGLKAGGTLFATESIVYHASAFEAALAAAAGDDARCRAWLGLATVMRVRDDLDGAAQMLLCAEHAATAHKLIEERARIHFQRGNLRSRTTTCYSAGMRSTPAWRVATPPGRSTMRPQCKPVLAPNRCRGASSSWPGQRRSQRAPRCRARPASRRCGAGRNWVFGWRWWRSKRPFEGGPGRHQTLARPSA